ncbi:MAG: hypothetical protein AB7V32_05570 [Candidatus Berkiella sp.]
MTKPFIHYNESQLAFHNRMLRLTRDNFGQILIPASLAITNQIPGPGKEIAQIIDDFEHVLKLPIIECNLLKYTPRQTEEAANNAASPIFRALWNIGHNSNLTQQQLKAQFYANLNMRYLHCLTLSGYLMTALLQDNTFRERNSNVFHQALSYFTLFSCVNAYNLLLYYIENNMEGVQSLINSIHKWHYLLETLHLESITDPDFVSLHQQFFRKFQSLLTQLPKAKNDTNLSVADLGAHVLAKTRKAQELGEPFDGKIIIHVDSQYSQTSDIESVAKLSRAILSLSSADTSARKQFLFYPASHTQRVEVVDAQWDLAERCFKIIQLHSSSSSSQHRLLSQLIKQLDDAHVQYRIIACQTNLQPFTLSSTSVFAYALSGIVSHLSYDTLIANNRFHCEQPMFMRPTASERIALERLNVQWITLGALGKKAVMMTNTQTPQAHQQMLAQLARTLPDRVSPASVFDNFRLKHGFAPHTNEGKPQTYHESLYQRLQLRSQNANYDIDALKATLKTEDNGQALRRAVDFKPIDEFEALLKAFKDLSLVNEDEDTLVVNAQDSTPGKKFTPLHLALRADKASRAVRLIRAGASVDIQDDTQAKETPKDIYQKAPNDSKVKRNKLLSGFLQR